MHLCYSVRLKRGMMKNIPKKRLNLLMSHESYVKFRKSCVDLDVSMSAQIEKLVDVFLKIIDGDKNEKN